MRKKSLAILLALALVLFPAAVFASPLPDECSDLDTGEVSLANSDQLSFLYIDSKQLSTDDTQYVVASFDGTVSDPVLYLTNCATNESRYIKYSNMVDETALFTMNFSESSTFQVSAISFTKDGTREVISFDSAMREGSSFEVVAAIQPLSDDSSVVSDIYSFDEDGRLVQESALDEALESASVDCSANDKARGIADDGELVVVIDPGHGGSDPGAVSNGLREADLTLAISRACRDELAKYAHISVYMTRDSDVYVGLEDRAKYARDMNADLFISIHINSGGGVGAEVWIPSPNTWYSSFNQLGEDLGNRILDELASVGLNDRGTKFDYYTDDGGRFYPDGSYADALSVIRNCRLNGILAVLVEHGFIDNAHDAGLLHSASKLEEMGRADARAIVQKYGLVIGSPLYGFKDIYFDTPHALEIGWLASSEVATGYDDHTFRPFEEVTRWQMAAFLYRLAGSPSYTPTEEDAERFTDVNESVLFYKEILWLGSTGISTGYDDGTFRPDAQVTRSDMSAFLRRLAERYFDNDASSVSEVQDGDVFSDVDSNTPHIEDIKWMANEGISTGYDDGTFRPFALITRSDMAAFLYRITNLPSYHPASDDSSRFSDVNSSVSHANDIYWLSNSGVTTGYDDGTFKPFEAVTRWQMAAFLYRMAGSPSYEPSSTELDRFNDVNQSTPFYKEILWLGSTGISTGYDDGTFRPDAQVTRSDMSAFLRRLYDLIAENDTNDWIASDAAKLHFSDVDAGTPHADDIWWLGATGVSLGYSDGTFGPYSSITRSDMAAFLHRIAIRLGTAETLSISIMGTSQADPSIMVAAFKAAGATFPTDSFADKGASDINTFAKIICEEAAAEGVRAEVVFAQALCETGWLRFGGSVKAEQCNFAGLGAVSSEVGGASFKDVRTGIRAQVQHLKAYASTDPLVNECVDPRFNLVRRGSATTLFELNGKWAVPGTGYGQTIQGIIVGMLSVEM